MNGKRIEKLEKRKAEVWEDADPLGNISELSWEGHVEGMEMLRNEERRKTRNEQQGLQVLSPRSLY